MKIPSEEITALLINREAILLNIRIEEENLVWDMDHSLKIPINELPNGRAEFPKHKLIVTAWYHKDRAYEAVYLKDGLLALAEHLRGDKAIEFVERLYQQ